MIPSASGPGVAQAVREAGRDRLRHPAPSDNNTPIVTFCYNCDNTIELQALLSV